MLVELRQQVELAALLFVADRVRRSQVEDRRALVAEQRALINRRQKTGAPVLRSADTSGRSVRMTKAGRFSFALPRP